MTDVALKEYLERLITELDRRITERFVSSDHSVAKAEKAMSEQLTSMNEFRDALKDQANRMATRVEVEKLDDAIRELQRARANLDGRLLVLSGGVSVVVSLILWVLTRFVH